MMGSPLPLAPSVAVGRSVRGSQVARVATQHYGSPLSSPARPSPLLPSSPFAFADCRGSRDVERERSHSLARWKKFARIAASDKRGHNDGRGRTWTWCAGSSCVACNNKQKSALQMAIPGVPAMPPRLVCLPAEVREEEALLSCNRVYDLTTPHISASPRPGPLSLPPQPQPIYRP